MSDPSGSSPPPLPAPATGDRLAQLAIVLLVIVIAAPILVSLVFMIELGTSVLAEQAGRSLRYSAHLALRFMIYGTLFGAAALAVRRFRSPPRRRRWWIGLGIAAALLLVPYISDFFLLLLGIITFRLAVP